VSFFAEFEFREVDMPRRIVYRQRFCDESGTESRHPGLPEFPAVMLTRVDFAMEADGATRVTVTSEMLDDSNAEEVAAFRNERSGMTVGWTGSFDRLETLLAAPDGAKLSA
jgi:uncharacterized protein YndB with AHSA1/START domain